jgi:hypothetical protein
MARDNAIACDDDGFEATFPDDVREESVADLLLLVCEGTVAQRVSEEPDHVCKSRHRRPGHCDIQIREQFTGQCSGRGDREADAEAPSEADEYDDNFLAEQLSSCQFCSCIARDIFAQEGWRGSS